MDEHKFKFTLVPASNGWVIEVRTLQNELQGIVLAEDKNSAIAAIEENIPDDDGPAYEYDEN